VLVYYVGESMVQIINIIYNGIKEPTCGYQNYNYNKILIVVVYIKVRESLCTRAIISINTILKHVDIREILPRYEGYLHVLSRIQVYFDLCVNFEHFQPPILTYTRLQEIYKDDGWQT
jgi:hypothetical protein